MRAAHGMARHRRQSPEGERRAASFRRNGECRGPAFPSEQGPPRRPTHKRGPPCRFFPPERAAPPSVCGEGAGARAALHIFEKKYRLLLTERAVCVIMKPKIVRSGLFLAKECRQILSARRVLPPSAGSCAYLCASVAAGSAAGKPLRRLQLHRFAWRTYLSLVEYRSASMLIYIGVGGGVLCFLLEIKKKAPPCGAAYRIGARRARTGRPLWTAGIAVP